MSDYGFFAAHLRFIVSKTEATTPDIGAMMEQLRHIAEAVETDREIAVAPDQLRIAARGLAGLAGFLQEQILPEVVAAQNVAGECQVRWVIDTSMRFMAALTTRAELDGTGEPLVLTLPPPPVFP